jgi:hypothetical protein
MLDIPGILRSLAERRPVFHSEADFQHEFAWELRSIDPACHVRLEVPSPIPGVGTTDIVIRRGQNMFGIELKYLTKRLTHEHLGESFSLKAQGATDLRRYDVLKDIQRLERFNEAFGGPSFVIVLTNEAAYWNDGRVQTIDSSFRLHHGRLVGGDGELRWADHAGTGTTKGREAPIPLRRQYQLGWGDYSAIAGAAGAFRYLSVEIG